MNNQLVVCAAIRKEGRIICGARHYDSIMIGQISSSEGSGYWRSSEQGFIDQMGNFLTRTEAHDIAIKNGQIRRRCGNDKTELFSENLY